MAKTSSPREGLGGFLFQETDENADVILSQVRIFRENDNNNNSMNNNNNNNMNNRTQATFQRSKSQDIMLSQSLGAYPSMYMHSHFSDINSNIYHSGYLLKRSNHPISAIAAADFEQQHQSLVHDNRHALLTAADSDNHNHHSAIPNSARSDDHDVFMADWDEDELPKLLPLRTDVSSKACSAAAVAFHLTPRKTSSSLLEGSVCTSTTTPSESFVTDHTRDDLLLLRGQTLSSSFIGGGGTAAEEAENPLLIIPQEHPKAAEYKKHLKRNEQNEDHERQQLFLTMVADFFGMPRPKFPSLTEEKSPSPKQVTPHPSATSVLSAAGPSPQGSTTSTSATTSPKRSAPIRMPESNSINTHGTHEENGSSFYHRAQLGVSAKSSHHRPEETPQHPTDILDEKGHVWRAKYCVLEDGVLYFYRNQDDAESPQAQAERAEAALGGCGSPGSINNNPPPTMQYGHQPEHRDSLAQSPMPRRTVLSSSFVHRETPDDLGQHHTHLWEKRTPLTMIGAVRSAEAEYGPHCFALLSPPREEDDSDNDFSSNSATIATATDDLIENAEDKLILRAGNADEMGEWLFEFHRSIAFFVKNLVLSQRGAGAAAPDYGAPQWKLLNTSPAMPFYNNYLLSPRQHVPLSHGHGRTLSRRRRQPPQHQATPLVRDGNHYRTCNVAPVFTPPRRIKQRSVNSIDWFPGVSRLERATSKSTATTVLPTPPSTSTIARSPESPPGRFGYPIAAVVPTPVAAAAAFSTQGAEQHQTPEQTAPPDPETERPLPDKKPTGKYIPPHKKQQLQQTKSYQKYIPLHLRKGRVTPKSSASSSESVAQVATTRLQPEDPSRRVILGGCADPSVVAGSIMDAAFISKKASKLERGVRAESFGYRHQASCDLTWDIGAVSECGIRESNEDSYLVAGNLLQVLENPDQTLFKRYSRDHTPGLFCVFDGHLGNQAARFAAEKLTGFLGDASAFDEKDGDLHLDEDVQVFVERTVRHALERLDDEFCRFCVEDKRDWESGTTALVAALVDNNLVVGNLGDARAVASRSVDHAEASKLERDGWTRLPESDAGGGYRSCLWKEISETHSPSREDERQRIEMANGWITYEQQIPIAQIHRLNFQDADVVDILKRCFSDRYERSPKAAAPQRVVEISRVCGELAVSRSLGDRDFKAAFNESSEQGQWDSPLYLSFPDDRERIFQGDLILNTPEFRALQVGEASVYEEFFLFACDGLWDVMDPDDAVRVTRDLLFEKKWPARKAAARLAELAVHLGSSDNITVIVVAFSDDVKTKRYSKRL